MSPYINGVIGSLGSAVIDKIGDSTEDCLYLDVYVPGKVIREPAKHKVPVVNWIYGGAFLLGWKTMGGLYSGSHFIETSKANMIFVAANYRLGALGWIAGPTTEAQATANLGLHDQRAALQWIQDNIKVFGGDKDNVSVWGESAGASSIEHHLVAFGGTQDLLFRKAALISPAYQPLGDRRIAGTQEKTFKKFEDYAGCAGKGYACLKTASSAAIEAANQKIQDEAPRGTFAVGPAADGSYSRQFAPAEYKKGYFNNKIESLIVTHTSR